MKMGTFSEKLITKCVKDVNVLNVLVSEKDARCIETAMTVLHEGGLLGDQKWGVIHEPWFEKVNNVSALVGAIVGATMVFVGNDIIKLVKYIKEQMEEESA